MVFALIMYALDVILPIADFDFFGRNYLIGALLVLALLIGLIAFFQFRRSRTTIDPRNPEKASKLVSSGIYGYSRNPMYLALLVMLLAWGLHLGNAFNILVAAGFVSYMTRFQIIPEERALASIFGNDYLTYKAKVPRWILI